MTRVVVVGAGLAGLVAGMRLAQGGARVTVVATGAGGLHLSPGTIDVLGYAPERVDETAPALERLAAERPGHPYAALAPEPLGSALSWFREAHRGPRPRGRPRAQHAAAERGRRRPAHRPRPRRGRRGAPRRAGAGRGRRPPLAQGLLSGVPRRQPRARDACRRAPRSARAPSRSTGRGGPAGPTWRPRCTPAPSIDPEERRRLAARAAAADRARRARRAPGDRRDGAAGRGLERPPGPARRAGRRGADHPALGAGHAAAARARRPAARGRGRPRAGLVGDRRRGRRTAG